MAPSSKEAERAELHKTIWRIANDLRGVGRRLGLQDLRARDAVLPVHLREPDRLPQRAGAPAGDAELRLRRSSATSDAEFGRRETVAEKGFYILPSDLFANVRKRAAA